MTNAELIKALRYCKADSRCGVCEWYKYCESRKRNNESCLEQLHDDAADALEAAEKRIADLEKSYSWKAYAALEESIEGYKERMAEFEAQNELKDGTITAMATDIGKLRAQLPKEGEWIEDDTTYCGADLANYKCSLCGKIGGTWRRGLKQDELPPFCGSCGARMRGEHDAES